MVKNESKEYVKRVMHDLKGERAAKKISVLKDTVLYWHNSSLFWRRHPGSFGKQRSKKMIREEEIKVIKEWYALPGYGKEGEVLPHECEWLLDRLDGMRRVDKRDRR